MSAPRASAPGLPDAMAATLAELRQRPIAATEKGFAALPDGAYSAASLARRQPSLFDGDFCLPLLTLREPVLRRNVARMAAYCAAAGVEFAPHGKTAMAPELAGWQLAAGAWAITVATIQQARAYRGFGVPRLLIANELVDPAGIAWLARELAADSAFEAYCYVDSVAGVRLLDAALRASANTSGTNGTNHAAGTAATDRPSADATGADPTGTGRRLPVLVELGHPNGRTGCRTAAAARSVADAVLATDTLRLCGVAGYEGQLGHDAAADTLDSVAAFCRALRALCDDLRRLTNPDDDAPWLLSAGGSAYFDVVTRELTAADAATVVLRSGAYLTHDHGFYAAMTPASRGVPGPELHGALELWAQVVSRPEPDLALLAAGRRDAGFDQGLPVPLRVRRTAGGGRPPLPTPDWQVTALNDQHAYLSVPADATLDVGDLVGLGISHPCTTLDKWRVIPLVGADDRVVGAVHTFF